jgi:hypothetical protein
VSYQLATTRRRAAPPLLGFVCLTEYYRATALSRLSGWRETSLSLSVSDTESTLRFPRRRPILRPFNREISSLRLWLPFRVSPVRHREAVRDPEGSRCFAPSEVSSPPASFSPEEPHRSGVSHPAGYVAPSGFLTLSTPCSLRDLPGLFHPGTTPGVFPFEALILVWCRTLSRAPRPSWGFLSTKKEETAPSGTTHTEPSSTAGLGISQVAVPNASMGFPAPRSCHHRR